MYGVSRHLPYPQRCGEEDPLSSVLWAARERLCRSCIKKQCVITFYHDRPFPSDYLISITFIKPRYRASFPEKSMNAFDRLLGVAFFLPNESTARTWTCTKSTIRYSIDDIELLRQLGNAASVKAVAEMKGIEVNQRHQEVA